MTQRTISTIGIKMDVLLLFIVSHFLVYFLAFEKIQSHYTLPLKNHSNYNILQRNCQSPVKKRKWTVHRGIQSPNSKQKSCLGLRQLFVDFRGLMRFYFTFKIMVLMLYWSKHSSFLNKISTTCCMFWGMGAVNCISLLVRGWVKWSSPACKHCPTIDARWRLSKRVLAPP